MLAGLEMKPAPPSINPNYHLQPKTVVLDITVSIPCTFPNNTYPLYMLPSQSMLQYKS